MKATIAILLTLLMSCDLDVPKKPFIIYYKHPSGINCSGDMTSYRYVDANGNTFPFCDDQSKYNIGDTIK